MTEWKLVRAADFIGFNPRESVAKGAMAKKVGMEHLQPFTRDIPAYEIAPFNGGSKFRNDDTLMARITPCLENGKTAQVSILEDGEVGFGSTEFIILRAKPGISDKDFIYYLAMSPLFRDKAIKSMAGSSGRQRVQQGVLNDMEFYAPPLTEQIEIGCILRALDDKIANNTKINNHLEQMAQAVYAQTFPHNDRPSTPIGGFIDVRDGTHDSPKAVEQGFPLVTSKHLLPYGVDMVSPNRISKVDFDKINERSKVDRHDILISMIGTIGLISLVIEHDIGFAIKNVGLFKTSQAEDWVYFVLCFLRSPEIINHIDMRLAGSTQKYISLGELRQLPVVKPTDTDLRNFNEAVSPLFEQITLRTEEIGHLTALRDALLPRLMSGELSVADADAK